VNTVEQTMRSVDVISVCNADGKIRPLRLQLQDEQHQLLRINIDEVVSTKEITHVGVEAQIFVCRARVWEKSWVLELKYLFRSHTWKLQRMQ
jgi:hypothetical protein